LRDELLEPREEHSKLRDELLEPREEHSKRDTGILKFTREISHSLYVPNSGSISLSLE
jgi:hypothetical protein